MARLLYTAPLAESSRARRAFVGKLPLIVAQVEMVPSSVARRNCAGVPRTRKSCATGLDTMPVGAEGKALPEGAGIPTTEGISGLPDGSKTLAEPRLLSAIKKDCPGWNAKPQGLSRNGSVCAAVPAESDTRLVCRNPPVDDIGAGVMAPPPQDSNAPIRQKVAQSTVNLLFGGPFTGDLPPNCY